MTEHNRKDDSLIELLIEEVRELRKEVQGLREENQKLTDAFNTAKTAVKLLRWLAYLGSSIILGIVYFKDHFMFGLK